MEGRMNQYKNKGKDAEAARGKRREFAVSLRKDKRREKVCLSLRFAQMSPSNGPFSPLLAAGQAPRPCRV